MDILRCNITMNVMTYKGPFKATMLRQSGYIAQVGEKRKESIDNIHRKIS
jgi:hypothetical protein